MILTGKTALTGEERGKYRFVIYYLYQQMHIHILNYITNAVTCFAPSAPSSVNFDIAFD